MQLRLIQRLIALMQKGDVTELELEDNQAGLRVRLRRGQDAPPASSPVVHVTQSGAAPVAALPLASVSAAAEPAANAVPAALL